MAITQIRPGILVALKTSLTGGVAYQRIPLAADGTPAAEGAEVTRWETTRVVSNKAAHERATKARSSASALVRKACAATAFGLLCPVTYEEQLDTAIAQARELIAQQNLGDRDSDIKVDMYVLKGRIAETDAEAARAIASEMRGLLDEMRAGIDEADVEKLRESASKARQLAAVLGDEQREKVNAAIETARAAARAITKRVDKGGELAALVVQGLVRGPIDQARFAFLETDEQSDAEAGPGPANALPAVNAQRFSELEVG